MCGIVGVADHINNAEEHKAALIQAVDRIKSRGPDASGVFVDQRVAIGNARLSIMDVSESAHQPMHDASGRYTIVYNGEIYNFKQLRESLIQSGVDFKTGSDTEVLLQLYIAEGVNCLDKLNGFFAFAIYDNQAGSLLVARDRIGIKPIYYTQEGSKLIFGSEMKSLFPLMAKPEIDLSSVQQYIQFNYIPSPNSIFLNVRKLEPGYYLWWQEGETKHILWYEIPFEADPEVASISYEDQQKKLRKLVEESVEKRLIADVPLGAFLSGGIDSSIIVAAASKFTSKLKTYTIGYADAPAYDETRYADEVARKFNTDHTIFSLTEQDYLEHLDSVLNYLDEPFADSSALPVYILSKHTGAYVKVALSGDGGDELFAGYNKHRAEYLCQHPSLSVNLVNGFDWLWNMLPQSRNGYLSNKVRQFHKFARLKNKTGAERYWDLCSFTPEKNTESWFEEMPDPKEVKMRKSDILKHFSDGRLDLNTTLYTDAQLVLPNDMLYKVDMMSMANSLEVRVPLLDHRIVQFAFSLPSSSKIDGTGQKRILKDAFKDVLPSAILSRRKQGFEIPLIKWFRSDLKDRIENEWLSDERISSQKIFDVNHVRRLKQQLFSNKPGDIQSDIWKLIVFQAWYQNYFS